ncbi:MAG: ABC transporter ATP-binding protein [Ignavibacteriaceae bacterium]
MPIILENVSKNYNSTQALMNISLKIENGKTTVLIGQSGCGKSTLIRIIIGLIKNDEGKVLIDDKNLSDSNLIEIRRKMGYVIQDGGLFPHLTAKGNVSLLAKHIGWDEEKINGRINELLELTKFPASGLERFPAELSGGQQQRVSLMRALMLDPEMLLLDEPLGALDPLIRYNLQNDLKQIFESLHKTVLMVTHDINEAGFFGDKIILMEKGEIIQTGKIEDLFNNPANKFVSDFIKAQRPLEIFSKK